MNLKRDSSHIVKVLPTEISWNSKEISFINVKNNYVKLCDLKSTPLSIFNTNLTNLNKVTTKNEYLQYQFQFHFCDNAEHLSTIQLRTICVPDYNIANSNIFCTQCGSAQERNSIKHITEYRDSNFLKFTNDEFNSFISRIKSTSGAKFRKESFSFILLFGVCNEKISISGQVLINGTLKSCKSCGNKFQKSNNNNTNNTINLNNNDDNNNNSNNVTTTTTPTPTTPTITITTPSPNNKTSKQIIDNINQYLIDFNSDNFNQLKKNLNIRNVKDFCYVFFDIISLKCGHTNDFNANQFIKPISKEWLCRECDQCLARGKLVNGLSILKDSNYINLNSYLIATQQIKTFNHEEVFQFKININNPNFNHSRELVGSQILSSTIIESINYHLDRKSFTINNYQQY
ncbi:hypothetical protein ACTFIR_005591 [Dictyostelium discoideum]